MNPQVLIDMLGNFRLQKRIIKLIARLAEKRTVNFYRNGRLLGTRSIDKGAAQGRVSSPIIFNTYVREINKHVGQKCKVGMYADDAGLYTLGDSEQECIQNLENGLTYLQPWLEKLNLKISTSKTKFMILSRKKRLQGGLQIRINNDMIRRSDSARFLGVILDTKLKWKPFVNEVRRRNINRSVNVMKALTRTAWGAHPTTLLQVYKELTKARADWACFCSQAACSILKKEIERGQNSALRVVLGCYPATPAVVLRDLSNQTSTEIRAKILTSRFLARIFATKSHPLNIKLKEAESLRRQKKMTKTGISFLHSVWIEEEQNISHIHRHEKLPCYEIPLKPQLDRIQQNFVIGRKIKNKEAKADDFRLEIHKQKPDWTVFYTDASKTTNDIHMGLAFTCRSPKLEKKFKMSASFSIAEGEAMAILQTLKEIKYSNIKKILICTDSTSTLTALDNIGLSGKSNIIILEIRSLISRLKSAGRETELWWCPSHLGIQGNEKADRLANEARQDGTPIDLQPNTEIYIRSMESRFLNINREISEDFFKISGHTYRKYKDQNIRSKKAWFKKTKLKRITITFINRIRAGHICTNEYLHRIRIKDSPACECGYEIQDLNHIYFNCDLTKTETENLYSLLEQEKIQSPYDIKNLAFSEDEKILNIITNFAIEIKSTVNLTHIVDDEVHPTT
ncbi:uncharacterized protein LOC103572301 [Microplitis demolitor]|uniref:uncharacterized protein LOC103572301 n=1 Tax=Microplitis demolitor TaxID=69319 RepID=UPI0004CD7A8D|nr:uncharacterized protein LOC103572301 [Microplitis demolitor]